LGKETKYNLSAGFSSMPRFILRAWIVLLSALIFPGCVSPLETYTVRLVPLPGSHDPSKLDNPRAIVGNLVLGLLGQQPEIEEIGDNLYLFTIEANITPGAIARLQTPSVKLVLAGWDDRVADNRPVPPAAEVLITEADLKTIRLDEDHDGKPIMIFEFKEDGQRKFEKYTAENIGKFIIVGIDGRVVNWMPIRQPVLGERGMIEGRFTKEQAIRYVWGIRMSMTGYRLQIVDNPLRD